MQRYLTGQTLFASSVVLERRQDELFTIRLQHQKSFQYAKRYCLRWVDFRFVESQGFDGVLSTPVACAHV